MDVERIQAGTGGRLRMILLAGAAALAASTALAAPDDNTPGDNTKVEELVVTAPNYVPTTNVAATKVAIPLIETPQSISVITRDQINLLNMQNLGEAVRYTAGITGSTFGSDERYDWLQLRGFNPVEYIDGLQAPVGSVSNVGLDLWAAQSVEILKGPSGVLYGQTPPGGLVNITTRRPQKDFSAELQEQYGSFGNFQEAGDVTGSLLGDGVLEGRLTVLARDRNTQEEFAHSQRVYVAPALTWNISPRADLTLLGYYQKDKLTGDGGGFLPIQGTLEPNPNGPQLPVNFNAGDPDYNLFHRHQYGVGYEFNYRFNDILSFHQNLKFSENDNYEQSVYGAGLEADLRTLDRYNFVFAENIQQVAMDSRLEAHVSTGPIEHVALLGVDYRNLYNHSDDGFAFGPTLDIYAPVYGAPIALPTIGAYLRQRQQQTGLYGQDEMKYGHWRLTLSAREDWLDTKTSGTDVTATAFTYRAGLNYVLDIGLAPYVAYSTSFLPITGADFNGTPFVPSTGDQIEGGIKYEPKALPYGIKLFTSAAVYDLTVQHVLTNDPNPAHAFFYIQTGEQQVKGVELEAVARINERLSLNGDYSYTDAIVTKSTTDNLGKQIPDVPRSKGSILADYTQQTGLLAGLGGGGGLRFLGGFYGDPANTIRSNAVTLVDAQVHYDFHKWRLSVNASNLFDKIYVQQCSSTVACYYAERRTVFLALDKKW